MTRNMVAVETNTAPHTTQNQVFFSIAAMHSRLPQWVSQRHQTMSAMTAAFAESGHGIFTGMSTRPRSPTGEPMTLGNMRANGVRSLDVSCWQVPPSDDHERGPVARRASAIIRPAHGVHPLRDHRCRCAAEPERETLTRVRWQ